MKSLELFEADYDEKEQVFLSFILLLHFFERSLLCHNMIVAVVLFLDQSENEESFG